MTRRLPLLALAAFVAVPVLAQDAPTDTPVMPADSTMAMPDSAATPEPVIEPDPERARELYREGNAMLQSDAGGALAKYDEALLYNAQYAFAALGRAQALTGLRQFDDAREAYEQAIALANATDETRVASNARSQLNTLNSRLAEQQAAQASAQAVTDAVTRAANLLQADPTPAQANEALTLLGTAEAGGVEPSGLAFYYAKAHNALGQNAEAVPYAQTAVDASEGQADRSAYYIQLGLAQKGSGDTDAARASFESAKAGSWASWADHYLRELDAETAEG